MTLDCMGRTIDSETAAILTELQALPHPFWQMGIVKRDDPGLVPALRRIIADRAVRLGESGMAHPSAP